MKKRWFTLIEMLIVIVIIGILAWALIPRIGSARDKANDTAREANVRSLATALVSYWLDHGSYPTDAQFVAGLLDNYSIPNDLFANQPAGTTYHYIQLDGWTHFIVYADLSENSDAWNCSSSQSPATCTVGEWKSLDTTKWTADEDTHTSANCKDTDGGDWTFTAAAAGGVAGEDTTFAAMNTQISNHWGTFCYLQ